MIALAYVVVGLLALHIGIHATNKWAKSLYFTGVGLSVLNIIMIVVSK